MIGAKDTELKRCVLFLKGAFDLVGQHWGNWYNEIIDAALWELEGRSP